MVGGLFGQKSLYPSRVAVDQLLRPHLTYPTHPLTESALLRMRGSLAYRRLSVATVSSLTVRNTATISQLLTFIHPNR